MTPEQADGADGVVGLATERAVAAIVDADATRDPETVRSVLDHVTDDGGRVSRDGIDETVSDVAKRLSTAETRTELARSAFEDAAAAADGVDDLDVVSARLDRYEATLDDIDSRVRDLGADLQAVSNPDDTPDAVYEAVCELRRIAGEADDVQQTADELQFDLDDFEAWLDSHERRRQAFEEDVDVVADALEAARTAATPPLDAESWVDAVLRVEVTPVLLADLRAELDDLRAMAERAGVDGGWADDLEDRLADLDSRVAAARAALNDAAEPSWRERYGARIAAFRETGAAAEPPVEWGEVQAELDRARALDEPYAPA
ncbi:halo transducer protein [Halobellus rubicundus]|uniref:Halo transducer protein n=1 Tax=Halobellus rubicundus TaxID=2996466 RepID=A0ABD5MCA3_9EURY